MTNPPSYMHKTLISTLLLALLMLAAGCGGSDESPRQAATPPVDTLRLLVARVQKCSRLHTTEFKIRKIITHDDQLRLKGSIFGQEFNMDIPAGDRQIAIPIDATVRGYIDFSQFGPSNVVRHEEGKIEIVLPDPQVELVSTKIDRKSVSEHVAMFRSDFSDKELSAYERQGREAIERSIPDLDIATRARVSATRILVPIVSMLGYDEQDITVTFRKELDTGKLHIISPQTEIR